MKQALQTRTPSGWWARLFPPATPLHEEPIKKPEISGVAFDDDSKRHIAIEPSHQEVLDIFDRWRAIPYGTFSNEREMAVFELFGITDVADRVREFGRSVCPPYSCGLDLRSYKGRAKEIMDHTASLHLNRSGIDHFGVPIFDFELLKARGECGALGDIRSSILAALGKREGRDTDPASAYYVFQGMRMLRHMERLMPGDNEWGRLSAAFPNVPVPGPLDYETGLAETEKLEVKAFRTYINKKAGSAAI